MSKMTEEGDTVTSGAELMSPLTPAIFKKTTVGRAVGIIFKNGHKKNSYSIGESVDHVAVQPESIQPSIFSSEKRREALLKTTVCQPNVFKEAKKSHRRCPSKETNQNVVSEEALATLKNRNTDHCKQGNQVAVSLKTSYTNESPSPERINIGKKGSVYNPQFRPVNSTVTEEVPSPTVIKRSLSKHDGMTVEAGPQPRVTCFSKRLTTHSHKIIPLNVQKSNGSTNLLVSTEYSVTEEYIVVYVGTLRL